MSAAIQGRKGYPVPYFIRQSGTFAEGSVNLQATEDADDFGLDDIHLLDLRLEKEFHFGDGSFAVGLDLFNAFNESTVLQRQHRLNLSTSDFVTEVVSPRVWRVGVRLRFD